jgi:pimeloyl-ACP methyl ester carboxylesterase
VNTTSTISTPIDRPNWLTADDWPFPVHALTVADHRIAYTDVGAGPTLLLVHTGMWSFVWRDLIADLAHDFRCVTLDAPGTGLSSGTGLVDLTMSSTAIDALVRHLDLRDIVLVLHDLGGVAALDASAAWTDRVRGLAAVNTFGWRPGGIAFRSMLALMGSGTMRRIDVLTGWLPHLTATRFGVGRHWERSTRRTFLAALDRRGRRSFHHYMRSVMQFDFDRVDAAREAYRALPAVTVFGERNDHLGFQTTWADHLDDLEQIEIPKGNHFPMCDAPSTVARVIRARFDPATEPASTGSGASRDARLGSAVRSS